MCTYMYVQVCNVCMCIYMYMSYICIYSIDMCMYMYVHVYVLHMYLQHRHVYVYVCTCMSYIYLQCVRVMQNGCGLELENTWVSKKTNGTWLQLVRSCTLSTVLWVPDFKVWKGMDIHRLCIEGECQRRGYWFLIHNNQTKVLDLMCKLIY